jgi:hypothetical protein
MHLLFHTLPPERIGNDKTSIVVPGSDEVVNANFLLNCPQQEQRIENHYSSEYVYGSTVSRAPITYPNASNTNDLSYAIDE